MCVCVCVYSGFNNLYTPGSAAPVLKFCVCEAKLRGAEAAAQTRCALLRAAVLGGQTLLSAVPHGCCCHLQGLTLSAAGPASPIHSDAEGILTLLSLAALHPSTFCPLHFGDMSPSHAVLSVR